MKRLLLVPVVVLPGLALAQEESLNCESSRNDLVIALYEDESLWEELDLDSDGVACEGTHMITQELVDDYAEFLNEPSPVPTEVPAGL